MSLLKGDYQDDALAFMLATLMAESDNPGDLRSRIVQYMDKAFGSDLGGMTPPEQDRANAIANLYAKADNIYHRIKN